MNTGPDFQILIDKTTGWDANKIKLLDQLISFFYANPAHPGVKRLYLSPIDFYRPLRLIKS